MAKIKFTTEVGLMARTEFRKILTKADFKYDLKMDLKEERGWLSSTFFVTMEGSEKILTAVTKWLKEAENESLL